MTGSYNEGILKAGAAAAAVAGLLSGLKELYKKKCNPSTAAPTGTR